MFTRRQRILLIGACVVGIAVLIGVAAIIRRGQGGPTAMLYVESNASRPNSNEMLVFRVMDGALQPGVQHRYPMHGSGSHDLSNSGVLDSDQNVITNPSHTLLFAVNASSDTIAVFHIADDGSLTPVRGSPFPSNGKAPASVGLAGDTLIVANKAQDGVRKLRHTRANYTSFHVRPDGSLSSPISSIDVPAGSSPLQVYVTPNRKVVISSEESGVFRTFRIMPGGRLEQGRGSPFLLDPRVFPGGVPMLNNWPAGLVSHPTQKILYAQVANQSKTVVYRWHDNGRLTFVRAMHNPKSFLPCWSQVNRAGTRLYTGNAGSGNMTVYDISRDPLNPRAIQSVALRGKGNPWNFDLDPSGRMVFMVDMRAVKQIPPGQGNELHALFVGGDGKLKEAPSSPIKIPVPVGTNPYGLAIVPTS